jgi:hypothetical protein
MKEKKIKKKIPLKEKIRKIKIKICKIINSRNFWIEYITLYFTILVVTVFVQSIIFSIELNIILVCLSKSLFTTILGILLVICTRRSDKVKKNKILGLFFYVFFSLPYLDLVIISFQDKLFCFPWNVLIIYILTYFFVGLFVDRYILFAKKTLNKLFDYSGHL